MYTNPGMKERHVVEKDVLDVRLSLVLTFYNAEAFVERSTAAAAGFLAGLPYPSELILADDGSSDATAALATRAARELPRTRVLTAGRNRGKGACVAGAFEAAKGRHLVFVDGDLAYPLGGVRRIVEELEAGADVSIACREHPDSRLVAAPREVTHLLARRLTGRGFNLLVRALALRGVLDTQAGLKGFRSEAARAVLARAGTPGFCFDVEALVIARRLGLLVREIPVEHRLQPGTSTVRPLRDAPRMLRDLLSIRRKAAEGAYGRIVVNADDFGKNRAANKGILDAFLAGRVHRASIMANGAAFRDAARMARERGLPVGAHGNLTEDRPLSPPGTVRSLVDEDGLFVGLGAFIRRYFSGRLDLREAGIELEAQLARLRDEGLVPGHLDSHHHIHYLPGLAGVFFRAAKRHGIREVRWGRPVPFRRRRASGKGRRERIRDVGLRACGFMSRLPAGLRSPGSVALMADRDPFPPIPGPSGRADLEIVCHPGSRAARLPESEAVEV